MSAKSAYNHDSTAASIYTTNQKLKLSVILLILIARFEIYYQVS